jgi:2-polyprenyl-3-methyl-5-hydroxy-6-metoxy-1,4-benzoquinol methylase
LIFQIRWKGKNYPKLELKKVSIEDYNTKTEFDVITLWHYLEHDYNPHQTIETLYNCLKPGGKIIIEIPDYKVSVQRFKIILARMA